MTSSLQTAPPSVSHHVFSRHTDLYRSDSPSQAFTLARTIESCISVVKVWVVQNKLQSNDEKTDSLVGSVPGIVLPSSPCVGQSDIPFCNAADNIDNVCVCVRSCARARACVCVCVCA